MRLAVFTDLGSSRPGGRAPSGRRDSLGAGARQAGGHRMPAPGTPGPLFPRGCTLSGLGRAGCVTISTDSKPPWWGASRSRLRAAPGDACSRQMLSQHLLPDRRGR